jgi:charged multivesicular body protein 4
MSLEREIYSIEASNINKETLDAMRNAGKAMQQIHAGLTVDTVDQTMYGAPLSEYLYLYLCFGGQTLM